MTKTGNFLLHQILFFSVCSIDYFTIFYSFCCLYIPSLKC